MNLLKCSTFILGILSCLVVSGQIQLSGEVHDQDTNQSIDFVNVFLLNDQSMGTVTDPLGRWNIVIDSSQIKDTLVFSTIGYDRRYVPLSSISDLPYQTKLQPSMHKLQEVLIIHEEGIKNLVRKAINRIPHNYAFSNHRIDSYYQYYTISDSVYAEFIEAYVTLDLQLKEKGHSDFDIYLNQLRRSDDQRNFPPRVQAFAGDGRNSIYHILRRDRILNKCISCFWPQKNKNLRELATNLSNYGFSGISESYRGEDTLVVINFFDKSFMMNNSQGEKKPVIIGEIVINKTDLAFERIRTGNVFDKADYDEVGYRKIDGRYYLSYLKETSSIAYDGQTRSYNTAKLLIAKNIRTNQKIFAKQKKKNKLKLEKSLRKIKYKYDASFWQNLSLPDRAAAPEALKTDLNKLSNLEDQYKRNQRRKS